MPFPPVVRVHDFDAAVQAALRAEHGYRHTAILHSRDVGRVTAMARAMNTTLFVHNAPSAASRGVGGPGYLVFRPPPLPDLPGAIALPASGAACASSPGGSDETEALVQAVTDAIMASLHSE